ncbi:hypothetical protein GCM10023107_50260 [Actinoplanes octamycinicus]
MATPIASTAKPPSVAVSTSAAAARGPRASSACDTEKATPSSTVSTVSRARASPSVSGYQICARTSAASRVQGSHQRRTGQAPARPGASSTGRSASGSSRPSTAKARSSPGK